GAVSVTRNQCPPLGPTVVRAAAVCRVRRVIAPSYLPIGVPAGTAIVVVKAAVPFAARTTWGADRVSQFQSVFWNISIFACIGRPPAPVPKRRVPNTSPSWGRIGALWAVGGENFASGWVLVIRF